MWPYGIRVSAPRGEDGQLLPLFPLSTLLTPGMPLSLHVFEPRYRRLVADLLSDGNPQAPVFGVVALRAGWEVGDVQDLHRIGTAARVTDVLPLADGRCNLAAIGERRFEIREVDTDSRPYLQARVHWLTESDGELSEALVRRARLAVRRHRQALALLRVDYREAEFADRGADDAVEEASAEDADVAAGISAAEVASRLSYAVAQQSWVPLADRQQVLAAPDTASRLRIACSVLRRETELLVQLHAVPVGAAAFRG